MTVFLESENKSLREENLSLRNEISRLTVLLEEYTRKKANHEEAKKNFYKPGKKASENDLIALIIKTVMDWSVEE